MTDHSMAYAITMFIGYAFSLGLGWGLGPRIRLDGWARGVWRIAAFPFFLGVKVASWPFEESGAW